MKKHNNIESFKQEIPQNGGLWEYFYLDTGLLLSKDGRLKFEE